MLLIKKVLVTLRMKINKDFCFSVPTPSKGHYKGKEELIVIKTNRPRCVYVGV